MKLNQLLLIRDYLKQQMVELDKTICSNKEHINKTFKREPNWDEDKFNDFLSHIKLVKETSGMTDSRKNMMSWHGYVFIIEDQLYYVRHGSNWCSDILDCGLEGKESPLNGDVCYKLSSQEDPFEYLKSESVTHTFLIAGYLLARTLL